MDSTTRALLVEVARTVLRVLGEGSGMAKAAPAPSSVSAPSDPAPSLAEASIKWLRWANLKKGEVHTGRAKAASAPAPAPLAQRGDHVRIWTGDMYATGVVDSVGRQPKGDPLPARKMKVRVKRAGVRDKLYTVDQVKAEIIKRGDA